MALDVAEPKSTSSTVAARTISEKRRDTRRAKERIVSEADEKNEVN